MGAVATAWLLVVAALTCTSACRSDTTGARAEKSISDRDTIDDASVALRVDAQRCPTDHAFLCAIVDKAEKICACNDAACVEAVDGEFNERYAEAERLDKASNLGPPTLAEDRSIDYAREQMQACREGLLGAFYDPDVPYDYDTGIPECDEELEVLEQLAHCYRWPGGERLREQLVGFRLAYARGKIFEGGNRARSISNCRALGDRPRQAAAAAGCEVPPRTLVGVP